MYDFFSEGLKRRDHVVDLDMLGRIILDCFFDKQCANKWTEVDWLR
jgi:hypothetical protein